MVFPYLWMVSTSFKASGTWYNISLIPEAFSLEHYQRLLGASLLPALVPEHHHRGRRRHRQRRVLLVAGRVRLRQIPASTVAS